MEILLMKNGTPRLFLTPEDVIDENFLEALKDGKCRLVNNTQVGEDVTLAFGLLIEPPDAEFAPIQKKTLWNLWGLFKNI